MYCFDGFTVDVDRLEVRRDQLVLALEPKAFRVLLYLIQNRERAVTKEELMEKVWAGSFVTDNALTRVIAQIRKQLGDHARAPQYIETLATTGYRFVAAVQETAQPAEPPARHPWLSWEKAAAGAAVVGLAIAWMLLGRPEAAPRLTGLRQITNSAAADLWPSFSPDASQIAYSSNVSGDFQVYVRSLAAGGTERQITTDRLGNTQPAWSPDGRYIAYVSRLRGGIVLLPVSGGAPRYLTDVGDSPKWSPDGRTLVYRIMSLDMEPALETTGLPDTTLMAVDVESGVSRPLTRLGKPAGGHQQASWMPDGRHVLFTVATPVPRPWILNAETGQAEPVEVGMDAVRIARVSPDLKYFYLLGSGQHELGLWLARIQSKWRASKAENLMPTGGAMSRDMTLSADGKRIAISQQVGDNSVWSVSLDGSGAAVGPPKPIVRDRSLRHSDLQFSNDGSKIAFVSMAVGGDQSVYTANADGSGVTAMTPGGEDFARPSWFGPEQTLVYQSVRPGKERMWTQTMGGTPRPLPVSTNLNQLQRPRFSRDGKMLLGHIQTPHGTQIVLEDLTTGAVRKVSPAERNIGFPALSPDGKWIAAEERIQGNASLVVLPADGGEVRTFEAGKMSFGHDWSPDSERVSFAGLREGVWNIYWVHIRTGQVQQLTHFDTKSAFVRYPSWSPKGDQIVFERNDVVANIYVGELR